MKIPKKISQLRKYILLVFLGFLLIFFCSTIQQTSLPQKGEYYYSSFLRNNYTVLCAFLFFFEGIVVGYIFKLNPWLSRLFLLLIFPLVSFYEATIYRGSHNLIPFELVIYFLFSLPAIAGVYIGKYISNKVALLNQHKK